MIVLDTHVLIYDALEPRRLSARARRVLDQPDGELAASDISLWEIGMLIARGRVDPGTEPVRFMEDLLDARRIRLVAITPAIAVMAQSDAFSHGDPADRIIAATVSVHKALLVTADARLRRNRLVETIW